MSVNKHLDYEMQRMNRHLDEHLFKKRIHDNDLYPITNNQPPMRVDDHVWYSYNLYDSRKMVYGQITNIEYFKSSLEDELPYRITFKNPYNDDMRWSIKPLKHNKQKRYLFYSRWY